MAADVIYKVVLVKDEILKEVEQETDDDSPGAVDSPTRTTEDWRCEA